MTKKRLLLILDGVVLAVAVIAVVVLLLWPENPRLARGRLISWEHYEQIKKGMSQDEVEAILGGPPGDFSTNLRFFIRLDGFDAKPSWERWTGDEACIEVHFGEDGKVEGKSFQQGMGPGQFQLVRLRYWLRSVWP
jgi:hypothetical protein